MLSWPLPQPLSFLLLSLFWPSVHLSKSSGIRSCQEVAGQRRLLLQWYISTAVYNHKSFLLRSSQILIFVRSLGFMRLDTCHSAHRIHVEHTDESSGQGGNMFVDGIRLLVRSPRHPPLPNCCAAKSKKISTGICAIFRTVLFKDRTSEAEHSKC